MAEIQEYVGLRFMTRFQCLGSACEDPCCRQWQIPVDEPHFQAIAVALGDTPEGKAELARVVRRLPVVDQQPERVGDMALGDDGWCVMREDDNLCSLHRRFGEDVLGDTCATYPRSIGRLGSRVEMSGTTSCPEVVRLCLLAEDGVEVVPFDPARFARRKFAHQLDPELADPDQRRFAEVRGLMLELLRQPYPVSSRLMFLAALGHRTAADLRRGTAPDDARLDATMASLRDAPVLEALHRGFADTPLDEVFATAVVLGVLGAERWPRASNFGRLVERVTSRYAPARKNGTLDPRRVWTTFRKRRDDVPAHLAARMEQYLRNYAINEVYQEWYLACPSLLDFVQLLLVQTALIRFLLISHPDTSRACTEPVAQGTARLDAAVVECVSYFSRAAHHTSGLGARIMRRLADAGSHSAGPSFNLAKL